jgi:effector-binding domain-containing protein
MSPPASSPSAIGRLGVRPAEEQTLACLPCRGAYWRLSGAVSRLKEELAASGLQATGPLRAVFLDDPEATPPESCRYILAYPVDHPPVGGAAFEPPRPGSNWGSLFEPDAGAGGGLTLHHTAAGLVAELEYRGAAHHSPRAYAALADSLKAAGLDPQGPPEEVYLAEPGTLEGGLMHALICRRLALGV